MLGAFSARRASGDPPATPQRFILAVHSKRGVSHHRQGFHRVDRGEVDASRTQSPVEESLNQQCQRSDKEMRSDSRLDLMVDRPQSQDILQLAKSPFYIRQVFVDRQRIEHVQ